MNPESQSIGGHYGETNPILGILPDDLDFAEEHFHVRTVKTAIEMFRIDNMPVSYDEQLEVAKILTYAKASLLSGGKRYLLSAPPPN